MAQARRYTSVAIGVSAIAGVVSSVVIVPGTAGLFGAALAVLMLAIAAIDARSLIIPNSLNAAAALLAVASTIMEHPGAIAEALAAAALRGAALGLIFLAIRLVYARLRGRQGLGLGDVKLAGVAGLWLDWWVIPISVEVAALAALAAYGAQRLLSNSPALDRSRLPFGLYFAPAIWLGWLLQNTLLSPY